MEGKLGNLRIEKSISCSGVLLNQQNIQILKEKNYFIRDYKLDGDAPKQFIKAYIYEEGSTVRKSSRSSWAPYIAKTAQKWYPHESVIEFMINRIGEVLRLNMNQIKLVRANGQIRFLSKYFLHKDEKLIHGAEICGEHLGDMSMAEQIANHKKTARELFTFEFIRDAIKMVFPNCFDSLIEGLIRMIVYDGLTGNNDRHFYNWGVIDTKKKSAKKPTFAPIYDSSRGLLWNYSDENIKKLLLNFENGGKKIVTYLEEACPRISTEVNTEANHFQLIEFIKDYDNKYKSVIENLASNENEEKVHKMLSNEFFPMYIPERVKLINIILAKRFEKVRNI